MAAQDAFHNPFPPYKVMNNIYYVGTEDLGSFLITTPVGHILVNFRARLAEQQKAAAN